MNDKYYNFRVGDAGKVKSAFVDKRGVSIPEGTGVKILAFIEKSAIHHFSPTDYNSAHEEYARFIRAEKEDGMQIDLLMSNFSKNRKCKVN